MAITTYPVTLVYKDSTYKKVISIKDFPDLGSAPDTLETTTLSDDAQNFILGIQSSSSLEFTANYTEDDYETVIALAGGEKDYGVYFGEDGASGKFQFKGILNVYVTGGGVNEVMEMVISIAPTSEIELVA